MPSGWSPRRSASFASMTTHADAPSESWLALPAVMVPSALTTGLRAASPSAVVSARFPSSWVRVTASSRVSPVALSVTIFTLFSGTISASSRPSRWAAAIRRWLSSA